MKYLRMLVLVGGLTLCISSESGAQASVSSGSRLIEPLDLNDLSPPEGRLAGMIRRYAADRGSLSRFYTAPYSAVRRARFKQFYTEWLNDLRSLDFESLSQQEKVDYILFQNELQRERDALDVEARRGGEMAPLIPFAEDLISLDDARRSLQKPDAQKTSALLNNLLKQIKSTRKMIEDGLKADPTSSPRGYENPARVKKNRGQSSI